MRSRSTDPGAGSPPYSGPAERSTPPPRMTIAWACDARARSSAGSRSAALASASATSGVASSHSEARPAPSSSPPALAAIAEERALSSHAPAAAINSGPPGGSSSVCNSSFSVMNIRRARQRSQTHLLPGPGAPAQEQRAPQHHDVDQDRDPAADRAPAELRQEVHPALSGGEREGVRQGHGQPQGPRQHP